MHLSAKIIKINHKVEISTVLKAAIALEGKQEYFVQYQITDCEAI